MTQLLVSPWKKWDMRLGCGSEQTPLHHLHFCHVVFFLPKRTKKCNSVCASMSLWKYESPDSRIRLCNYQEQMYNTGIMPSTALLYPSSSLCLLCSSSSGPEHCLCVVLTKNDKQKLPCHSTLLFTFVDVKQNNVPCHHANKIIYW